MKKIFLMLPVLAIIVCALASCMGEVVVIDGNLGLGVHTAALATSAEGEEAGAGDFAHTACAVILDGEGKIQSCRFDLTDLTLQFDKSGKALTPEDVKTARELGDKYKPDGKSSWAMQTDVFEQKVEGKTLEEAKALVGEDGKGNEELQSLDCTMDLSELVFALEKACNNAKIKVTGVVGASVGMSTDISELENAEDGADGKITAQTTFAAAAALPGGIINGALTDEIEVSVTFDKNGASTTDLTKTLTTKRNLGDAYGMSKHGADFDKDGRVLEWYAQADAFDAALVGRRPSGVSKMADSEGHGTESIIKAGCTIKISNMVKAVERALKNV